MDSHNCDACGKILTSRSGYYVHLRTCKDRKYRDLLSSKDKEINQLKMELDKYIVRPISLSAIYEVFSTGQT